MRSAVGVALGVCVGLSVAGCPGPSAAPVDAASIDDAGNDAARAPDAFVPEDAGPLVEPRAEYGMPGPHAVGSVTVAMVDRTGARTLPVEIWYPAVDAARAEATTGRPIEAFEAGGPNETTLEGLLETAPSCVRRTMHAAAAPAVREGADLFPAVVFSHCHTCTRYDMAETAERLASHGIVVAAPDHVDNTLWDAIAGDAEPVGNPFLAVRAVDVSSVLDRLLDATAEELPADLRGRIDPDHVGVMGHSFGAATTSVVMRDDDRFVAALAVAAPISVLGSVPIGEIEEPYAFLLMREDNSVGEAGNMLLRANHRNVGGSSVLVELDDAGHWSIADIDGLVDAFDAGCGEGVRHSVGGGVAFTYVDPNVAREVAADVAAGFFATHLLEDPGGETVLRRLDGTSGAHVSIRP